MPGAAGTSWGPLGAFAIGGVDVDSSGTEITPGFRILNTQLLQLEEGKTAESVADRYAARWLKILAGFDFFSEGEDRKHPGGHHFYSRD